MLINRGLSRTCQTFFRCSVNQNNVFQNRNFVLSSQAFGPGADDKYKSEEERSQENEKAKKKRQRLLGTALAGGALAGSLWGYLSYTSKKKENVIGNDDTVK